MKIADFITQETQTLVEFSSRWWEHHDKDKDRWPLEMSSLSWFKHYLAFCAKQHEDKLKENANKSKAA